MKNSSLWIRTAIIIAVTIFGIYLVIGPRGSITTKDFTWNGIKNNLAENINLGLDLKGGSHLVMRVKTEKYLRELTISNQDAAFNAAKEAKLPVTDSSFVAENGKLSVTLNLSDPAQSKAVIDAVKKKVDFANWTESDNGTSIVWSLPGQAQTLLKEQATEQAMQIIASRINAFGVKEPTLQRRGTSDSGEILLQMPGVDDPERVKKLIGADSKLSLMKVVSNPSPSPVQTYPTREAALQTIGGKETPNRKVFEYTERDDSGTVKDDPNVPKRWVVTEYPPIIEGNELRDASAVTTTGNEGDYQISFSLKPNGAKKFGEWTGKNINNYMAVVLNDKVKSVAFIKSQIFDQGQIDGRFTKASGEDLALTLKSGALPTEIEYLEERTVGPSLGADAIRAGLTAAIGGLAFVVLFMLFYYRGAGINAVVALTLNMILTLAALIVLDSTLTLPGMAGLILGVGMAVDSNVLIFERMREEIKAGKKIADAIKLGFDRAWLTIIDSHVTTIIAGSILYLYGSGPIRGFAVTLILGLLINLFSAVFVSRTIFLWLLERNPNIKKLSV
ncbi:MAG: protein translocase subunit SecD [Acidobacteria bacterium]|nr:protein translocase subunit SecD [Acidobacteriota bacterium]